MNAPDSFVDLLERTFRGRLRIRWSASQNEFHIEQRVGNAIVAPIRIEEGRDDLIRARDGYDFVMSIRTGDRMPCPECNYTLHVPAFDTWDIKCPYCELKGRTRTVCAGFWPLNDRLITYLQKIDPLRTDQKERAEAADLYNRLLMQSQENDAMAPGEAAASDRYNRLVGIEQTGYTGKEFRGTPA